LAGSLVGDHPEGNRQKPVPIHPLVAEALDKWRSQSAYRRPASPAGTAMDDYRTGDKQHRTSTWDQQLERKGIRLAHVPAHLLHPFEKRRHRVQGNAGM